MIISAFKLPTFDSSQLEKEEDSKPNIIKFFIDEEREEVKEAIPSPKKAKLIKKGRGKDLSTWRDVINKTLVRALKRFHTSQVDSLSGFSLLDKDSLRSTFLSTIEDYCSTNFPNSIVDKNNLIYLMGFMVHPETMKREKLAISKMKLYQLLHQTMYAYSHTKLDRLLAEPVFSMLF